ncbi:ExeA family protein [Primorskyibacter sp. 2E233]|uniref:ExeA family protein n=1 Tax=Primorskyibacter sp. 2E233 TaxID=3413431 RepID=UPI003BF49A9F
MPFALTPDPDFLFWSPHHRKAFTVLEYGLMSGAPVTVLTGEVGSGKTTLLHALLAVLPKDTKVGLISNANAANGQLMRWIANSLDIPILDPNDTVGMFESFQSYVIEQFAQGRRVVLIIDEAQNLGPERLEELRMLTNINAGKNELLQLMLIGQPELRSLLSQHSLRQFAQRVSVFFHLKEMDLQATGNYIRHRLKHVGGTGDEFSTEAIALIHEQARGVPRVINKLCDLSMVYAASAGRKTVDLEVIEELLDDGIVLFSETPFPLEEDMRTDVPNCETPNDGSR